MITQKQIQEGIQIELQNSGDDIQLAEIIAIQNLREDKDYYKKMNASGLQEETEVAIINKPTSPNATSPQAKLTSSSIGVKPCKMKPLKSDNLKAPETKIDNITNQGRTPPEQPMPSLVDLSGNPVDTTTKTVKPNSVVLTKTHIPVVYKPQTIDPTSFFGNKINKALKDEVPSRRELTPISGVAESINENDGSEDAEAYDDMKQDLESGECAIINAKDEVFYCGKFLGKINDAAYYDQQKHHRLGNPSTLEYNVFPSQEVALKAIDREAHRKNFFPNIYTINDHGNVTQITPEGKEVKSWV